MKILVLGASGATGKLLVDQLLQIDQSVKVIVRSPEKLPDSWQKSKQVTVIKASVNEISPQEMVEYIKGCQAVACCLGHNMTLKGLFGKPRRLVSDAVKLVCKAIQQSAPARSVKFALMNTAGNRNRDLNEPITAGERLVIALLRLLLPPHPDNEQAADFLRTAIGQKDAYIKWVVVRPDNLVDEDFVSKYEAYASPIRSALFNPGKTSRINVGHFMAVLITDQQQWDKWKGKMPVIYNSEK